MSRFFAGVDSESESSSSDEEFKPVQAVTSKTFAWSDDEEETKRVVRSAKDKRFEELQTIIKNMRNHMKIKDMSKVLTDFEDLGKGYDKARKVVEKEGIPRFYIRTLAQLDDFINECWEDREGRKTMSKNNAKCLTTMRQKLRKYNRDFEKEIASYKENPDHGEDGDQSEEEDGKNSDSDSEDDTDFKKKTVPKQQIIPKAAAGFLKTDGDEDSDSDDSMSWDSSEMSSSSDEDESKYEGNLAAMFLKRPEKEGKKEKDDDKKEKEHKRKRRHRVEEEDDEQEEGDGEWQEVVGGVPMAAEKPKMFSKDTEVNHEAVLKKLHEIETARGKKGTDRSEQIELLAELRKIAALNNLGVPMDVKLAFHVLGSIYDYNPNIATCMKAEMWERCLKLLQEILTLLKDNPNILIGEAVIEDTDNLDGENLEGEPPYHIRVCILTMTERMDEEFIKMLQACDAHSTEYVDRLKDERVVCEIIEDTQKYLETTGTPEEICRIYLKRIEHTCYKFDATHVLDDKDPAKVKSAAVMNKLCKYIYTKDSTDRIRTRAILYHIYHHSLHDRWYEARDLMLMSHLQDTIMHSDIPTQINYNRALVQLGLCAFRKGLIRDAHNCLVDIQSLGRAKELLAQGLLLQRQQERTPEQEKIEKRRQMPYHMHVNLELLECSYLVSAMLLEVPYMAAHEFDARRRMISKNFHHVLRVSDRQTLVGPPESMREHLVAASKAMKKGNWRACQDFIINEKMNAKVWSLFQDPDSAKKMILQKIQEESLRTYLFSYSSIYDSLCLITLADMFELDLSVTLSVVSKMIINEDLMASLDEPTQSIVMHRTEPTRLQSLALQLSEKVASLVDNNERIMEMKNGNFFFQGKGGYQGRDDGGRQNQNYSNRGGGYGGGRGGGFGGRGGGFGGRGGGFGGGRGEGKPNVTGGNMTCYKCGQTGHVQRECPQNRGGSNATCYKCGQTGHMQRDCPQQESRGGGGGGGGGGSNATCYKCGQSGHMQRDCPQQGGGGGGGGGGYSYDRY